MVKPIVFLFSGQGSHYYQMGRELFEKDASFRCELLRLDQIAIQELQCSIVEQLYRDEHTKAQLFDPTLLTHPAIYMVQLALLASLAAHDVTPDYVLGASLGSYVAAAASGVLSAEDGLRYTIQQAKIFDTHCQRGGMLAVLAPPDLYERNADLFRHAELAGVNFHSHFVLSGDPAALTACERFLQQSGIVYQRLAVSHAFHSRHIDDAELAHRTAASAWTLKSPRLPLVCCAQAAIVESVTIDSLWQIARAPIRFRDTIARLERMGNWLYLDLGPAGTLAGFIKYNLPASSRSEVAPILTPYGQDHRRFLKAVDLVQGSRRVGAEIVLH